MMSMPHQYTVWIVGYHSHAFWGVKGSRIENHPDPSRKERRRWELPMSCLFSGGGQFGFISQDTQDGTEAAELNCGVTVSRSKYAKLGGLLQTRFWHPTELEQY